MDFERPQLQIKRTIYRKGGTWHEEDPKSAQSRRTLPLPSVIREILVRQRERQSADRKSDAWRDTGFVWTSPSGVPRGDTWVNLGLARLLKAAGLPRVTPHALRHSAASILLERDISARVVSEMLGHSGINLTLSTYSHVTRRLVEAATDTMNALASGPASSPTITPNTTPDARPAVDDPTTTQSQQGL